MTGEPPRATDVTTTPVGNSGPRLVEVRDLVVTRSGRRVLEIEQFGVTEHETVAVVGPNGAGKSTLLLTLASLVRPAGGSLRYRGTPVTRSAELSFRRKIGLVFPDPLLLDTSVFANVASGLRFRGVSPGAVRVRVDAWLERLGIGHLHDRPARHVSSGEAQRVSLARSLVLEPEILLLDEPFAAVDVAARAQLMDDLERLLRETAIACVLVTHDLDEAGRLGTRLAVVIDGHLRQEDTPTRVFTSPVDADVAAFVGVETRVPGRVISTQDGLAVVDIGGHQVEAVADLAVGRAVLCCLRPEDVTVWVDRKDPLPPLTSARNRLGGRVRRLAQRGPLVQVTIDCEVSLVASITRASAVEMALREGDSVIATFKASAVHLIPLPG
jgi:tungstate transport system ATP-binding protein